MTALSMTALLGFLSMATDVGNMFRARRSMQTVADAAALAGASEYPYGNATPAAQTAAQQMGSPAGWPALP